MPSIRLPMLLAAFSSFAASAALTNQEVANLKSQFATSSWGDTLDADTRMQFDQVYEAILGLMSPAAKEQ